MRQLSWYSENLTFELSGKRCVVFPVVIIRLRPYWEYNEYKGDSQVIGWDLSIELEFWHWILILGLLCKNSEVNCD